MNTKESKDFRFDPNFYVFVVVNVYYNLTQFGFIFHVIATLFSFPSHEADIHFYTCSIGPFHYEKEDQCGYRGSSQGGQPGYILINGEFVAIHASIMKLNETWSVAKSPRLPFKIHSSHMSRLFPLPVLWLCCVFVLVFLKSHCWSSLFTLPGQLDF